MKKNLIYIICALVIVAVIVVVMVLNQKSTNLPAINSAEDLSALVDKVYEGQENMLASLMTQTIDVADKDYVNMITGLENGDDLQYVVASEPMMTSQAYSFVLVKVKDGVSADAIAKEMSEKVNASKWICVTAEKIYATSSGDIACLVMASEELAKPVYDSFKTLAGNVGQEYEKTNQI